LQAGKPTVGGLLVMQDREQVLLVYSEEKRFGIAFSRAVGGDLVLQTRRTQVSKAASRKSE